MPFYISFTIKIPAFSYFLWLICNSFGISYNTASQLALWSIFFSR